MKKIFLFLITLALFSCNKNDSVPATVIPPGYNNRIWFILQDNLNFSSVASAVQKGELADTLKGDGPYTFLAPSNPAYSVRLQADFYYFAPFQLYNICRYTTLKGKFSFAALSLGTDTVLTPISGGKLFVKKYLSGADTLTVVNSFRLQNIDVPASNGYIDVLSAVLSPDNYATLTDFIRNDTSLTLFSAAMEHSGLSATLGAPDSVFTLLAPANGAFTSSTRFTSIDTILKTDPAVMKAWLQHYIVRGRYFTNDMFQAGTLMPLDNQQITISGSETGYNTIRFNNQAGIYYSGNSGYAMALNNADQPVGNGILFKISAVLN